MNSSLNVQVVVSDSILMDSHVMPCVELISGFGGKNLTDGDNKTRSPVRIQNKKYQYRLGIHDNCVKPKVKVAVTIDNSTTCDDVKGTIFMKKTQTKCGDVTNVFHTSSAMADNQYHDGKRVCSLICKCAGSLNQCVIHIFSGITAKNLGICEIKVV